MTSLPELLDHSRSLIGRLQHPNGAYPASPTFSAYRGYCWFRDGSFIADGMSAVGDEESASRFFDWCGDVIWRHRGRVGRIVAAARTGRPLPDAEMLPARFLLDGSLGGDDWWDFQLDGYGTWLWAVAEHAERHGLALDRWAEPMRLTVEYLVSSWRRPCYDWWEEHAERVHVSTLGCVAAGLRAAAPVTSGALAEAAAGAGAAVEELIATDGAVGGRLVKWIGGDDLDGSLSALVAPLDVIDPRSPLATETIAAVDAELTSGGGVYRFLDDTFFGGGRWPLLTCFLGLAKLAAGDRVGATACLDWAASAATADGDLPEQVDGRLLHPSVRQHWIDKWGPVATPLLWSHAMVLRLAVALGDRTIA